jgi:spermidine/putrescine transport system substrate-binding protein
MARRGDPVDLTPRRRLGRREFLRRAGVLGLALPAVAALAACARRSPVTATESGALPLTLDPIPSGLPVERDPTLRVYEWKDYLSARVLSGFERAFAHRGVRVEVESFVRIDEAVARLQDPSSDFDVVFPTIDVVRGLVDQQLLRPLNHDYLPNLANLWSWFRGDGPPYDPGQRYTTPYTVYSSGIGWRADLVDPADAPDASADPAGILWNPRYRGKLGIYDDYLEALSLALLRDGVLDLRAATDDDLRRAATSLEIAVRRAGVVFTVDGAEDGLAEGEFAAHQAWSGDVLTAARYARADRDEDAASAVGALRYATTGGPGLVVGCDLTAICARGRNPVLAHAFVNHLLDFDVAMANFSWNGYQPPLTGATREAFADPFFRWRSAVPPGLLDAVLSEEDWAGGQMLVGFGPSERARWLDQWNRVLSVTAA